MSLDEQEFRQLRTHCTGKYLFTNNEYIYPKYCHLIGKLREIFV